jgi:hypothetical protein
MLCALVALFAFLVGAAVTLTAKVEATNEAPRYHIVRDEPTTTVPAPQVCVVDDTGTNWAARFGVEDRVCT